MGFFQWLSRIFGFSPSEPPRAQTVEDVADRLDRCADRYGNSSDVESERAARDAASRARKARSLTQALEIEREFEAAQNIGKAPPKPQFKRGETPTGKRYVSIAGRTRVGGSRAWRNNNPGYIRCSPRAVYYGAIGCDGEYAIFPDYYTGRHAMIHWFGEYYPTMTIREALREQLPPEAGPDAAERTLQESGLPPELQVRDLNEQQLNALGESMGVRIESEAGEQFDPGTPAPDWVSDITAVGTAEAVVDSVSDVVTDNS